MVMAMRRANGWTLDQKRVIAITGVLLIHLMVLAAMLLPRQPAQLWKPQPPEIVYTVDPSDPPPPPKPPEPIVVPPPPIQIMPLTAPPQAPTLAPVQAPPVASNEIVVAEQSDLPVVPNVIVDDSATGPAMGTQGNLVTLTKLRGNPPAYPRRELARGVEGEVVLRVLVGADGLPQQIDVVGGTRNRNFESAAIRAIKRWRFQPHTVDGVPRAAWARVPVVFSLD
jgi:protein TonB